MIGFDDGKEKTKALDGNLVETINPDLTQFLQYNKRPTITRE